MAGNWSTKSCINRKTSKLNKMTKRLSQSIRYYHFLQRLKYKCDANGISFKLVDEKYTSCLCSNCGYTNKKLKSKKKFKCSNCKIKIDRDINSCRNIIYKGLHK